MMRRGRGWLMSSNLPNAAALDYLPPLPGDRSAAIGCIGAGFIMTDCHLVAYRQAGFNPIAIASGDGKSAATAAARHAIPRVYDSYQQLLADPRVTVLDVAVPPDVQFQVIADAVRHNDHIRGILAQKPLGMNYAQARQIVRTCEDAD